MRKGLAISLDRVSPGRVGDAPGSAELARLKRYFRLRLGINCNYAGHPSPARWGGLVEASLCEFPGAVVNSCR